MESNRRLGWLRSTLGRSLDFLLPPACAGCHGALGARAGDRETPFVCLNCHLGLRPVPAPICDRCGAPTGGGPAPACLECADWPPVLHKARAAAVFAPPASALVHALKYQGWRGVGGFMGREMARRADPLFHGADVVVPVPTSLGRTRRRGYNQAQVIAKALAKGLGKPLVEALERPGTQGTQTTLSPDERRANVHGAFRLRASTYSLLESQTLVLVDDVITTGATLSAAALALEPAAPRQVVGYAFTRRIPLEH